MAKYVFGTPSASESKQLWLPTEGASIPTGDEFERVCIFLEKKLNSYLRPAGLRLDACYFRGDFWGDRTQYLEVEDREALTPAFFETISDWLKELEGQWRVAVPHETLPGDAIIVYDSVIRFEGDSLPDSLTLVHVLQKCRSAK